MTTSIDERPVAGRRVTNLLRRLQRAQLGGWLVRVHLSTCGTATGSPENVDRKRWTFELCNPGTVQARTAYDLDDISELEVLSAVIIADGQRVARIALVAGWRSDPAAMHQAGDLIEGTVAVGADVVLVMPDGVRRRACVVSERAGRIDLHLQAGAVSAPLAGFQPERPRRPA